MVTETLKIMHLAIKAILLYHAVAKNMLMKTVIRNSASNSGK